MAKLRYSVASLLIFVELAGTAVLAGAQAKTPLPDPALSVVVLVDKSQTGTRYRVDSKDVSDDPLRGIALAFEKRGGKPDVPVLALIDDSLPISVLSNVAGLIGKVGFTQVRYFRCHHGSDQIGEISFGPFYAKPPAITEDVR